MPFSTTAVRQETQIRPSDTYDDNLAAGIALQTGSVDLETDLNGIRSQLNRILDVSLTGNWYDDIPTVNLKQRGLLQLNTGLDTLEVKPFCGSVQVLTDITVPGGQNFIVLSVAGSQTPTENAAVGAVNTEGAIVAFAAGFGSTALDEVSGPNAISPLNLVSVVDGSTGERLQSSGRDVFGLLQSESATDGAAFDDVANRVQITFVRVNATGDDLEAVPIADIAGRTINYAYTRRLEFANLPENFFKPGVTFVDQTAASVDVTLQNAISNQTGPVVQTNSIDIQIADGQNFTFEDSTGTTDLFAIIPNVAGDEIEINVDDLDINTVNPANFNEGITVDTSGEAISVGVVPGTIASDTGNDLRIFGANELFLDDVNQSGSANWTQTDGIKLSETTAEWDTFFGNFGQVSILNALNQAASSGGRVVGRAKVTTNIPSGTNVTGAGGSPNLDAQLPAYSAASFESNVNVYVNGILLFPAAGATEDVFPGTTPADGDLTFTFNLRGGGNPDVITMEVF